MSSGYANRSSLQSPSISAYLMWFSCALFFFYQYILRVSPGVLVDEIRQDFSLSAEQFSTFGAYYLYAYSLIQIPLGVLVDRVGVRKTVVGSIGLCIAGSLILWETNSLYLAQFSRILIGVGSASAFMCSLKVAADHFPPGKRGMLMGLTLALGTFGAFIAGKPLVWLLELVGWRSTILYGALMGLPVFFMALFLLPSHPTEIQKEQKQSHLIRDLLSIFSNRKIMLYAALAIGLYTPLSALADLWGTSFLVQKYTLTKANAAQSNMMMYLGMGLGSLILPWFCEKYKILNQGIQFSGFSLFALFSFILFGPSLALYSLTALFVALGFFCGAEMCCFTGAVLYTTKKNSGLTIGVVNTLNMLGGAILQQIIGFSLDWQWTGLENNAGLRIYSTQEYVFALTCLLVVLGLCCLASLSFFQKDKTIAS